MLKPGIWYETANEVGSRLMMAYRKNNKKAVKPSEKDRGGRRRQDCPGGERFRAALVEPCQNSPNRRRLR